MTGLLEILATIVGVLIPFGYLFQTYEIVKNKSSKNVSVATYIFFEFAFIVWILYGISIRNIPIIAGYGVGMLFAATTIIAYFIYKK